MLESRFLRNSSMGLNDWFSSQCWRWWRHRYRWHAIKNMHTCKSDPNNGKIYVLSEQTTETATLRTMSLKHEQSQRPCVSAGTKDTKREQKNWTKSAVSWIRSHLTNRRRCTFCSSADLPMNSEATRGGSADVDSRAHNGIVCNLS